MSNVGFLVTQTHGADETLIFGVTTGEVGSNKSRLGDHALPGTLLDLLAGRDDLEHFLLADTTDLGQGNVELGRLFSTLVLDGTAEGLGGRRVRAVQQIGGHGLRGFGFVGGLDVALLVRLDLLLHLNLLIVALLLVQLGPETTQVLCILRGLVSLTGRLLSQAFFVIEAAAVQLTPPLHILVLRLYGDMSS